MYLNKSTIQPLNILTNKTKIVPFFKDIYFNAKLTNGVSYIS